MITLLVIFTNMIIITIITIVITNMVIITNMIIITINITIVITDMIMAITTLTLTPTLTLTLTLPPGDVQADRALQRVLPAGAERGPSPQQRPAGGAPGRPLLQGPHAPPRPRTLPQLRPPPGEFWGATPLPPRDPFPSLDFFAKKNCDCF